MHPLAAPSREFPAAIEARRPEHRVCAPQHPALSVECLGYLVPATSFDGIVHSVFVRACNVVGDGVVLTLAAYQLGDGPMLLRLAPGADRDFRTLFRPGERFRLRHGVASTLDIVLHLAGATIWRPAPPPAACNTQLAANLRFAARMLEYCRVARSSVIDRDTTGLLADLEGACRALDVESATADIHRLVGWGEGLTPAGDDVLVGLLASLTALAPEDAGRLRFLRSLADAIVLRASRTTVISGHYLRLAAQGHFNADVTHLRNALMRGGPCDEGHGGDDCAAVTEALRAALDVGETSGADMVTGMLAGFSAWSAR